MIKNDPHYISASIDIFSHGDFLDGDPISDFDCIKFKREHEGRIINAMIQAGFKEIEKIIEAEPAINREKYFYEMLVENPRAPFEDLWEMKDESS